MPNVWDHSFGYNLLRRYVNACARTSFSSVTIEGMESIPSDGAVILAPNHCAALMDAMMVLVAKKHDEVAFGARYDIFKNAKLASVLNWLRILPLARERDGLQAVAENDKVFDQIVECLDNGVPFTIYSEGTHRAQRGMLPVKKGIFRVARRASERLQKPVYVVPMGLDYEYFFRQAGRARIRIGEAINVTEFFKVNAERKDAENYRELCSILQERDLALIGHYSDNPKHHSITNLVIRALTGIVLFPFFAACWLLSMPIWAVAEILLMRMKDKSWTHTVYFAVRLFLPVFWPFFLVYAWSLNFYRKFFLDCRNHGDKTLERE